MARILLVDDYPVTRLGLRHILERAGDGHEFGEAAEPAEALQLLRQRRWDVMLLDIALGGRSGIDLLKRAVHERPALRVLVVSMYPEEEFGVRALQAGASGYVVKDAAPEVLADAVQQVVNGHKYVSRNLTDLLVERMGRAQRKPHEELSDREFQILRMLASGMRVSDVAQSLALSISTVSTYRVRLLKKLNLRHNAQLTLYAVEHGLVDSRSV